MIQLAIQHLLAFCYFIILAGRRILQHQDVCPLLHRSLPTASSPYEKMSEFWEKNKKLQRPLSPHLTIYSPQITSMLSITHRGTGMALSLALSGVAISALVLPHDFTHYWSLINDLHLPTTLIASGKFAFAFALSFHVINGIRHLAWDMGHGYKLTTLYQSGWTVLGLSLAITLFFVLFR